MPGTYPAPQGRDAAPGEAPVRASEVWSDEEKITEGVYPPASMKTAAPDEPAAHTKCGVVEGSRYARRWYTAFSSNSKEKL